MKTLAVNRIHPDSNPVITTDCGEFIKVLTYRGYSEHHYSVEKLSGEWPSKDDLCRWLDHRYDVFGAQATIDGNQASVVCYIN